jgi:membrane associated rhomboid family serine protease
MARWPYANWVLIGVTCLISVVVLAEPPSAPARWDDHEPAEEVVERLRHELADPPVSKLALSRVHFRIWQPFTHVLVHADLFHLAGNMLFLFVFGNAVNARLGHGLFLALYFAVGAVAGLAWLGFDGGMAVVGASGAIMGIVGVFLVLYPLNNIRVFIWWFVYLRVWEVSSCWLILLYLVFDLFGTVTGGDGVAYISHLAGAAVGIGVGVGLLATGVVEPIYSERNMLQVLGWQAEIEERPRRGAWPDLPVAGAKRRVRVDDEPDWGA